MASTDPKLTFTIKCTMNERWARQFLGMLQRMQHLGSMGSTRTIQFVADGDGDFRPKFEWDKNLLPEPVAHDEWPGEENMFDAG
jgi:hypothetical protein